MQTYHQTDIGFEFEIRRITVIMISTAADQFSGMAFPDFPGYAVDKTEHVIAGFVVAEFSGSAGGFFQDQCLTFSAFAPGSVVHGKDRKTIQSSGLHSGHTGTGFAVKIIPGVLDDLPEKTFAGQAHLRRSGIAVTLCKPLFLFRETLVKRVKRMVDGKLPAADPAPEPEQHGVTLVQCFRHGTADRVIEQIFVERITGPNGITVFH